MATFTNKQFGKTVTDPTFGEADYTWGEAQGEWGAQEDSWSNQGENSATFVNQTRSDKSAYGSAQFGVSRYGQTGTNWSNQSLES